MIYIDTSALGAIFFREPGAADLVARLEQQRKARLMILAWTLTEMASIGGIKQRTGAMDARTRQQALANFQRFASINLGMTEMEPADFHTTRPCSSKHPSPCVQEMRCIWRLPAAWVPASPVLTAACATQARRWG